MKHNRRDFVGLTAAGLAGASFLNRIGSSTVSAQAIAGAQDADLVVFNAKVYTVDAALPRAEAFAVKAGRFLAVGSSADMKALAGRNTQTLRRQADDRRARLHRLPQSRARQRAALRSARRQSVRGRVRHHRAASWTSCAPRRKHTPPGTWVEGYFFDDTKVKDKRELNVHDLDQVSKEHPVVVQHRGGHTSFYNSKALEMAGINEGHAESGRRHLRPRTPTASSMAASPIARAACSTASASVQRSPRISGAARSRWSRIHLQTVRALRLDERAPRRWRPARAAAGARTRRPACIGSATRPAARVLEAMITSGITTGFGDEWIKFGATSEHTVDGSFSERTMALSVPYPGDDCRRTRATSPRHRTTSTPGSSGCTAPASR